MTELKMTGIEWEGGWQILNCFVKLLDFILFSIFLLGFFFVDFSPADCSVEDFVLLI